MTTGCEPCSDACWQRTRYSFEGSTQCAAFTPAHTMRLCLDVRVQSQPPMASSDVAQHRSSILQESSSSPCAQGQPCLRGPSMQCLPWVTHKDPDSHTRPTFKGAAKRTALASGFMKADVEFSSSYQDQCVQGAALNVHPCSSSTSPAGDNGSSLQIGPAFGFRHALWIQALGMHVVPCLSLSWRSFLLSHEALTLHCGWLPVHTRLRLPPLCYKRPLTATPCSKLIVHLIWT